MIFPSNRVRIMVATKPIDFRKGHDSLAAMVKNELRHHRLANRNLPDERGRSTCLAGQHAQGNRQRP